MVSFWSFYCCEQGCGILHILYVKVTKSFLAPQVAKQMGVEASSIQKLQNEEGVWKASPAFHIWFITACSWFTEQSSQAVLYRWCVPVFMVEFNPI